MYVCVCFITVFMHNNSTNKLVMTYNNETDLLINTGTFVCIQQHRTVTT